MAAAPVQDTVNIVINDQEIAVPKGELIVESVKRLGLEIPIFCYHPRMKPVGMCRMCLVEVGFKQPDGSVRKMPKPQAGCTLPASEGMVVYTDTEMVHRDRKGVLELLLINHPLDCPVCDRGGECPLQNNTLVYGPSTSRFIELKRHLPKAFPLSDYVTLDLERCIQCGRCVRFTEEISGDAQLAFRFRGALMQPSTFEMTRFDSKFSGNVIEICPVGALTNSVYRFRARPWDLETKPAICTQCSNGCAIWFDYRVDRMARINGRTNEDVNEEWTCDKGKFGHEYYNSPMRLKRPRRRDAGAMVECSWADAYETILPQFVDGGSAVGMIGGAELSNEAQFLLQRLARRTFKTNNLSSATATPTISDAAMVAALGSAVTSPMPIAEYEAQRGIFVFGTSIADDLPILYLRVRKAATVIGTQVAAATASPTEVDGFAKSSLRFRPDGEAEVLAALIAACRGDADAAVLAGTAGCDAADVADVARMLKDTKPAIIATRALASHPKAGAVLAGLTALAAEVDGRLSVYGLKSNDYGAMALGVSPDLLPGAVAFADAAARSETEARLGYAVPDSAGMDADAMLRAAATGRLRALWLIGWDPLLDHPDRKLALQALERVPFLVVQGISESPTCAYASVVLPMSAPAEDDGTYTNMEGRVQRMQPVLPPKGEAKGAWRIFTELGIRATPETPYFNPSDIFDALASAVPSFAGLSYAHLSPNGSLLQPVE